MKHNKEITVIWAGVTILLTALINLTKHLDANGKCYTNNSFVNYKVSHNNLTNKRFPVRLMTWRMHYQT